ncbi:LacI family DNA-binding transcriptional regulator [Actinopolymorpha sp. B11F2]|uniref:LacI family DNA-binding transcriptional regulator n=1 Tax=Actinopolymorpha sp. B11F2 TaxID=3160862 RepID=UPI0032E4BA6A
MSEPPRAPTVADVARLAGVSKATVSYVLSGRRSGSSRVSEETRQRVLDAVRSLGYAPNQSARALSRRRTDRVCLVLPRLGAPYFEQLAWDLTTAVAQHGFTLVLAIADEDDGRPVIMEQLRRRLTDGVVVAEGVHLAPDDLAALVPLNVAVVTMTDDPVPPGIDAVRSDASEACRGAVQYLAAEGHRRIAFIGHFLSKGRRHRKYDDYRAGLRASGLPLDRGLVVAGAASRAEAYRNAQKLLAQPHRPSAVFAASDIAAVSTMWAARDAGLRVPDDLAVVGVGDIPEDLVMNPQLTTVGPTSAGAAIVADLLISRLTGEAPAEGRTRLQTWELVRRGSA